MERKTWLDGEGERGRVKESERFNVSEVRREEREASSEGK